MSRPSSECHCQDYSRWGAWVGSGVWMMHIYKQESVIHLSLFTVLLLW